MAKINFHGDLYENNNRVINVSNAGSSNPAAPGTANPGSSTAYARADHVHPLQTTVNGHTVNADVPANAVFTDNNTTYTFAEGSVNGKFSVTPSGGTAQSVPVHGLKALAYKDSLTASEVGALPSTTTIPTKTSDLTNDSGFITTDNNTTYTFAEGSVNGKFSVTPSGGTAQSVTVHGLKALAYKDSLTASEVGALPDTTSIPTKTSDLTNDSGFITEANAFIVNITRSSGYTSDKTFTEIYNAIRAGLPVYAFYDMYVFTVRSYSSGQIVLDCRINLRSMWTFTISYSGSNTTVALSTWEISTPSVPSPINCLGYIRIEYNETLSKWEVTDGDINSMQIAFDNGSQGEYNMDTGLITLIIGDTSYQQNWDDDSGTNADNRLFYLTNRYTTFQAPSTSGESGTFYGHLVFTATVNENGITKRKTWRIDDVMYNSWSDEQYTITYTEETLPRIFSGTSTSVDSSPQEGDICFVYTA